MRVRLRCIMYRSCAVMAALLNPWQCILVVESSVSDAYKDRSCDNATAAECMIRGCIVKWHSGTLHTQGAGYYEVFVTVHQPVQYCIRHTHLQAWCSVLNRENASDGYTMILQHWLQSEIGLSLMSSVIETRALVRRTAKCYSKIDGRMNKKTKQAITYLIASTIQVILKNSAINLINVATD